MKPLRQVLLSMLLLLPLSSQATGNERSVVQGIAETVKTLQLSSAVEYNVPGWDDLERSTLIQYGEEPSSGYDRTLPDGLYFGFENAWIMVDGRRIRLAVSGARSFYQYLYFGGTPESTTSADVVAGFEAAGYRVSLRRCPVGGGDAGRWYRIETEGKQPAHMFFGPVVMAGPGNGIMVQLSEDDFGERKQHHPERYVDCTE